MKTPQSNKIQKFHGRVVSDKMDKTIVVRVDRLSKHPKYKKIYKVFKKYKVHDPQEKYGVGDLVEFIQCRPISKEKKWKVIY